MRGKYIEFTTSGTKSKRVFSLRREESKREGETAWDACMSMGEKR